MRSSGGGKGWKGAHHPNGLIGFLYDLRDADCNMGAGKEISRQVLSGGRMLMSRRQLKESDASSSNKRACSSSSSRVRARDC